MATRDEELRIRIRLDEAGKLSADLGGVRKNLGTVDSAARKASGGFGSFSVSVITLNQALELGQKAFRAVSAVVTTVAGVLGDAIEASNKQEEAVAGLNATLRSSGQFTEKYSQELQELASQIQATTKFGDEQILGIEQLIVAMGAAPDQVERLTRASLDLAVGLKGANAGANDAAAAAKVLGKAVAGEFGSLSEYGILVDKNASDTEKLDQALQQIEKRFGGQAAAAAETFGGKITQINNVVGDLREKLGDVVKQSDFLNDVLEATHRLLVDLDGAAGDSTTSLTRFVDEGLRKGADGALLFAQSIAAASTAVVALGESLLAVPLTIAVAGLNEDIDLKTAFEGAGENILPTTNRLLELTNQLIDLRAEVDKFGTDAPRKLGEGLGGGGAGGGAGPAPGSGPTPSPSGRSPVGPVAGGGAAVEVPIVLSGQEAQIKTEIERIQRLLDSETAFLPAETRLALEHSQARLEQELAGLQPPSIETTVEVNRDHLFAERDRLQGLLDNATLEQSVAIQARIDEYDREIARLTGETPPPVDVPVDADTSRADQSIKDSATEAETAFDGPATKLKQIKDDAGNIKIVADGDEANTAIESVEGNFDRLLEKFNEDNPKLAIDVDEAVEGLVVVTEKGVEVRRELEGQPILVKVNTGDASQALASLKAEAEESPTPTPIRVDTSGAIAAINALRAAASEPIVIPVQASGSPSLEFTEYFADYAPGVLGNFFAAQSGATLQLYTGLLSTVQDAANLTGETVRGVLGAIAEERARLEGLRAFGVQRNLDTTTGQVTELAAFQGALSTIEGVLRGSRAERRNDEVRERNEERRHSASVAVLTEIARTNREEANELRNFQRIIGATVTASSRESSARVHGKTGFGR